MDATTNTLNWFEIPTENIERAAKFYEAIFGIEMAVQEMGGIHMAFFPYDPESGKLSGALIKSDMHVPSATDGPALYLNANPDLSDALGKVEEAGGKIVMPKTQITEEIGYMAFFTDSEGNRMALHSQA
ncbi:MAG: VOC family protein [Cytophagales bacterium]|nr:VOC family protein [Cytophagales bacterium]